MTETVVDPSTLPNIFLKPVKALLEGSDYVANPMIVKGQGVRVTLPRAGQKDRLVALVLPPDSCENSFVVILYTPAWQQRHFTYGKEINEVTAVIRDHLELLSKWEANMADAGLEMANVEEAVTESSLPE